MMIGLSYFTPRISVLMSTLLTSTRRRGRSWNFSHLCISSGVMCDETVGAHFHLARVAECSRTELELEEALALRAQSYLIGDARGHLADMGRRYVEIPLRANREGFLKFQLRPRRLVDVSKVDM